MKHSGKTVLLLLTFCLLYAHAEVMKITLKDSSEEINPGLVTSWVFNSGSLNVEGGSSFSVSNIARIEFLPDGSTPIASDESVVPSKENFYAVVKGDQISLNLPQSKELKVGLYSLNGRYVAELFRGVSSSGVITLKRSSLNVAPGIYSIVVSNGSSLFVQKLSL